MVSVERIYQYIYQDQSQGGSLYKYLRTAHRWRNRVMIDQRPEGVTAKERFGDWEVDTIVGKNHKPALVTLAERKSQF